VRKIVDAIRGLDLPVELVLVSHGDPVLSGAKRALARALEGVEVDAPPAGQRRDQAVEQQRGGGGLDGEPRRHQLAGDRRRHGGEHAGARSHLVHDGMGSERRKRPQGADGCTGPRGGIR